MSITYVSWGPRVVLKTTDGRELRGHVNYSSASELELRTAAGEFVTVARANVKSLAAVKS